MEKTLIIIKPDAVKNKYVGDILKRIEKEKFQILGMKYLKLSMEDVMQFYIIHKERPFYKDLCNFMASGPVLVAALQRENAVLHWREIIGSTDPKEAKKGTIRNLFAENKERNSVHGSDSKENALSEISFFFKSYELILS